MKSLIFAIVAGSVTFLLFMLFGTSQCWYYELPFFMSCYLVGSAAVDLVRFNRSRPTTSMKQPIFGLDVSASIKCPKCSRILAVPESDVIHCSCGNILDQDVKVCFPNKNKIRCVYANQDAIVANLTGKKNYPTIIVVDDGKLHEFHECRTFGGTIKFDVHSSLPSKVFLETSHSIEGFLYRKAEQTFLYRPVSKKDGQNSPNTNNIHQPKPEVYAIQTPRIGDKYIIVDVGKVYSNLNQSEEFKCIPWKSQAGKSHWGSWRPVKDLIGEVVAICNHPRVAILIYMLKIESISGIRYVLIGRAGLAAEKFA